MQTSSFHDRLTAAADHNRSWLVVGLDPVLDHLPSGFSRDANGVIAFNRAIIDVTADLVLGYKLNFAFYEVLGPEGWRTLHATRAAIPPELLTIADAKRGDIGHTAAVYAHVIFDILDFDAATIMPYTGYEGAAPFLQNPTHGAFVVCRTSNRDNSIQSLLVDGRPLYQWVAQQALGWGNNVGLVVGATDIDALRAIRSIAPAAPLLIPGVGPQGGNLDDAVQAGSDGSGRNALLAVSRAITAASTGPDFAEAARAAAADLRTAINNLAAAKREARAT
jgi:orotidine-5'-phosphate decarboxylase